MIGNGVSVFSVLLTCVVKSNMFMSHDALYRCTKGRTIERGPSLAGERHRAGRRRHGSVTRFWIVAPASLSLPRRGGGDRPSRPHYRARCANHAEDPRQRRARSAQLFGSERTDAWRNCCECHFEVPQGNAQAWLRRKGKDREVCLDYAFDRLLTAKLQQVYEILVPDRVRVVSNFSALNGDANEDRGDLRQGILGQAEGRGHHCQPDGGVSGVCSQGRLRRSA